MRNLIWVIIVLVIGFVGWKFLMTEPPQDLPQAEVTENTGEEIASSTSSTNTSTATSSTSAGSALSGNVNKEKSTVSFVGYGPGKEHPTTFAWTENLSMKNGVLAGTATFDTASVKTNNGQLDKHLCTDDFFNCPVNKQIVFTVTSATPTQVTGNLAFAGKSHSVTFPITISGNTLVADFRLDRTPFNFKYTLANATAVDKEVRAQFNLVIE